MTTSTPKRPTYRAYAVKKRGETSYWREIGAVWSHEGGEGFTLKLDLVPLDGSDIVIRKPKAQDAEKGGGH